MSDYFDEMTISEIMAKFIYTKYEAIIENGHLVGFCKEI
jgi:hypothetical protein